MTESPRWGKALSGGVDCDAWTEQQRDVESGGAGVSRREPWQQWQQCFEFRDMPPLMGILEAESELELIGKPVQRDRHQMVGMPRTAAAISTSAVLRSSGKSK
jgi:hypothetical protein